MRNLGLAFAFFLTMAAGCSATEKSLCDKDRQCRGGNDADFNACVQSLIYEGKIASDYGCSDAYNALITCVESTSICDTLLTVKYLKNSCNAQIDSLNTCEKAASVRGDKHFLIEMASQAPK